MLNDERKKSPWRGLRVFLLRDETGRLPTTCSAAPSATILFGQFSRRMDTVNEGNSMREISKKMNASIYNVDIIYVH